MEMIQCQNWPCSQCSGNINLSACAENLGKPWCLGGGSHLFNLAAHWAHCHRSAFCVVVFFFPHDVLWRRVETPHTIKLKELHMQSDFLKGTRVTRFVE